jgi:hypothetical protein
LDAGRGIGPAWLALATIAATLLDEPDIELWLRFRLIPVRLSCQQKFCREKPLDPVCTSLRWPLY